MFSMRILLTVISVTVGVSGLLLESESCSNGYISRGLQLFNSRSAEDISDHQEQEEFEDVKVTVKVMINH